MALELNVNGDAYELELPVGRTLAETLRDDIGLTGTKIACAEGHCGACTVLLDGVPVYSCITLVHTVGEREVTTIEGLRDHPLVEAFVRTDALQCGFCTPGQIVAASALVEANPQPTRTRSGTGWPATSVAAARIRRSRRRSRRGKADPNRERSGGPVRGGLARRRGRHARAVARGPARCRREARHAGHRPAPRPRRGALHGRPQAARDAPCGRPSLPARARAREDISLESALAAPGVRAAIGPGEANMLTDEPGYQGHAVAAIAAETYGQARAALDLVEVDWEIASRCSTQTRRCGAANLPVDLDEVERGARLAWRRSPRPRVLGSSVSMCPPRPSRVPPDTRRCERGLLLARCSSRARARAGRREGGCTEINQGSLRSAV